MSNLYIPFCSLILSMFLICLFIVKVRKNKLTENIYYFNMIVNTLLATCFCILSIYLIYKGYERLEIVKISNKLECFTLFNFSSNLFMYIYHSCKYKKNIKKYNIIINLIVFILMLLIPSSLKINKELNYMVVVGPLIYLTNILVVIALTLTSYIVIKKYNELKEKIIPVISIIVFLIAVAIIREIIPEFICMEFLLSFSTLIMYHTIENPDMKLLKELHKAKEISDNANEEKTMFLYNMTQEIRNTTDKINDEADIILDSDSLEQDKDSARNIKGETAKFRSTVNDIMDVSAIDTSSIKIYNSKYNIKNLLKEIITIYTTISKNKNLEFRTNIEHNIPKLLYGDSINLKKSIMNILTTSIKSTDKGYIEFTVNTIIKNDICRLIITIEDSSIGKSSSELENIKQNNKSINESYKLITLMNGTMIISSDYGIGTKYKLIIDERIVNTTNPETNKYLKDYENKKILVIDDNKQTGLIFTKYLKNNHIAIDTAYTGRETLNKIKAKNKYDLIILDEELSQITGYELLKELKRLRNFTTKVILLTKDNNYEYNKKYQEEGFTDILIKPFKKDILLTKLDKYLETK